MTDAAFAAAPDTGPVDLRHLDGMLRNLDGAARAVAEMRAALSGVRNRLAAAPDDPEARRAVRMAGLQVRGTASQLALDFAALSREGAS